MAKKLLIENSVQLLYTIFILTIVNLGYFILNKDNQSLLLFISISAVVYMIECNMIYSLLYPLIIVNGLNLLKNIMTYNHTEGFVEGKKLNNEDKLQILTWIQENIDSDEMTDYTNYATSIDDELLPLLSILENISVVEENGNETDFDDIDELIKYVTKIRKMKNVNKDELKFVNNMVDKMMNELDLSTTMDEESETENKEENSEMYVNMIKESISKKEDEIDELKKELAKKTNN